MTLPGRVTPVSLTLPAGRSLQDWIEIGRDLARVESASQWWIGDFVLYGTENWSEEYMHVLENTGLSGKTLDKKAAISESFALSRRRESLSWSHHDAVATLKPEIAAQKAENLADLLQWWRANVSVNIITNDVSVTGTSAWAP